MDISLVDTPIVDRYIMYMCYVCGIIFITHSNTPATTTSVVGQITNNLIDDVNVITVRRGHVLFDALRGMKWSTFSYYKQVSVWYVFL